jgi:hypothetical protein
MSYCVNCGVELASSERKCPLCGVEVVNPRDPSGPGDEAFPQIREPVESAFDRNLWIKIVSIALALPAAVCFASNVVFHSSAYWSLYVIGGLGVAWAFCVTPFLFKRYFPLLWIVANTGVTLGYLRLIEYLSGTQGWFLPLALPIVLGVAFLSLVIIVLIHLKVLRQLFTASAIFLAIGLLSVLVEISVNLYVGGEFKMVWSWFSLMSCVATAGALVLIERQLKIKEKLKRRLHI